jgi:hypothetical protein
MCQSEEMRCVLSDEFVSHLLLHVREGAPYPCSHPHPPCVCERERESRAWGALRRAIDTGSWSHHTDSATATCLYDDETTASNSRESGGCRVDGSVNGDLEGFKGTGLPLTGDNPAKTIEPFDVVGAIAFRQAHWQRPPAKRAPYDRGALRWCVCVDSEINSVSKFLVFLRPPAQKASGQMLISSVLIPRTQTRGWRGSHLPPAITVYIYQPRIPSHGRANPDANEGRGAATAIGDTVFCYSLRCPP